MRTLLSDSYLLQVVNDDTLGYRVVVPKHTAPVHIH